MVKRFCGPVVQLTETRNLKFLKCWFKSSRGYHFQMNKERLIKFLEKQLKTLQAIRRNSFDARINDMIDDVLEMMIEVSLTKEKND